jgi:chaperonin GroES
LVAIFFSFFVLTLTRAALLRSMNGRRAPQGSEHGIFSIVHHDRGVTTMIGKIRPLYDRILVKRREHEETTAGGIIIPDTAQERTQTGTVVAVGQGRITQDGSLRPLIVKAGDIVFFGKFSGTEADKEHIILREDEVLGIVEQ